MVKGNYSVLRLHATAWMLALFGLASAGWAQPQPPKVTLRVISGTGSMAMYANTEVPFWTQELLRMSGGKYTATINRYDLASIPLADMLKVIELGVTPFGTVQVSSVYQSPEFALPDLAGMNPDLATLKHNLTRFRPYLEKRLQQRHGVKLLAMYSYPEHVLYCKNPITRLADLAGRRVRVVSLTQADFVEGLGGIPIHLEFRQVTARLERGDIECAISAAASGNLAGIHRTARYLYAQPITWSVAFFGANQTAWNDLPPDLQSLLTEGISQLQAKLWAESQKLHAEGMACNQGLASCTSNTKGRMKLVYASPEDKRLSLQVFNQYVLPKWLSRCKVHCQEAWDITFAPPNSPRRQSHCHRHDAHPRRKRQQSVAYPAGFCGVSNTGRHRGSAAVFTQHL